LSDAGPDRSGAYDDNLAAALAEPLDLVDERLKAAGIEKAIRAGQDIGADLDHDTVSQCDDFLPKRILHACPFHHDLSRADADVFSS
jgi:hypothetical protein